MNGRDRKGRFILTFHGLGEPSSQVAPDELAYWVGERSFREMIEFVAARPHPQLPPIEVTFDDGNVSDIQIALPLLLENGLFARFFVLAGRIGGDGFLSKSDIRELSQAGMTIGSHGWDHVDWRKANRQQLDRELRDAKSLIEDVIGNNVSEVGIPFGHYNRWVIQHIQRCGFSSIFTSDGGMASGSQVSPRNTIRNGDDASAIVGLITKEMMITRKMRRKISKFVKSHI